MKSIIIIIAVLIHFQSTIGMGKKEWLKWELLKLEAEALIDPNSAMSQAIAWNIGASQAQKLSELDLSEIEKVWLEEMGNCKGYSARLYNGDLITAELFVKGPLKGQYSCNRVAEHPNNRRKITIPLANGVFEELRLLYEKSEQLPKVA